MVPSLLTRRVVVTRAWKAALEYWMSSRDGFDGGFGAEETAVVRRRASARRLRRAVSDLRAGERDEWLFVAEVVGLRRRFHLLERGLLLRVGGEGVFVGLIGGGPERRAERDGIVVDGGHFDGAVAAAAGAVGFVVADEDGDAGDAAAIAADALGGAEGGAGFEVVDVFDAVLDEEGLLEAGELELGDAAVELGEHGGEDGIFVRRRRGIGTRSGEVRRSARMWSRRREAEGSAPGSRSASRESQILRPACPRKRLRSRNQTWGTQETSMGLSSDERAMSRRFIGPPSLREGMGRMNRRALDALRLALGFDFAERAWQARRR